MAGDRANRISSTDSARLSIGGRGASTDALRILIIEDSEAYASLVAAMLEEGIGAEVSIIHCRALAVVCDRLLEEGVDVVLLDLSLPDAHKLEALELGTAARHAVGVDTPISLPKEACWAYHDRGAAAYD